MVLPEFFLSEIRELLVFGGLGDLEKFRGLVWGPKRAKNTKKWFFLVLGSVLGETSADQIRSHAKRGPSESRLGSHVSLEPVSTGSPGEGGDHFIGWGPVLSVRDPTDQKYFGREKYRKNIFCCGFKKRVVVQNGAIFLLFRPLVHPVGAVRNEKT